MIRLTLAQMRLSLSRLVPAGLAIALGTAFVAATLVAGNVMTRSTYDGVTAQYGRADLVVSPDRGATLTGEDLATVRRAPGVTAATGLQTTVVELTHGGRRQNQPVIPTTDDAALTPLTVSEGVAPTTATQIALPASSARRLDVAVGDTVIATWSTGSPTDTSTAGAATAGAEPTQATADLTVTGLVEDPNGAYTQTGGMALAVPSAVTTWSDGEYLSAIMLLTPDAAATRSALAATLPDGTLVRTRDEAAAASVSQLTDGSNQLVAVVLGFAGIALLVAALVIANTFQVIVAQRTRTLALLRCVGARRSQLRGSVLLEGTLLGLTSSVIGVLGGLGLAQAALLVLGRMKLGFPLPATLPLTVWAVVVPLVVGTAVTVGACFVPARAATRVAPVAALRPADAPTATSSAGRVRGWFALVLTVAGGALLGGVTVVALGGNDMSGGRGLALLGLGVLGGAVSFVGILVGAVLWIPRVVAAVGRLMQGFGPAARLAAANTLRNPRRTAATSTALLIGVTLVVTMSTGAATARRSINDLLDSHFPVDLVAAGPQGAGSDDALPARTLTTVQAVHGIGAAVPVRAAAAELDGRPVTVYGLPVDQATTVLRDASLVRALSEGKVLVPKNDPAEVTLTSPEHSGSVTANAQAGGVGSGVVIAPLDLLDQIAPSSPVVAVWARLAPDVTAATVLQDVQDALADGSVSVSSAAAEREYYEQIIDTLLGIVVGLLAVAVVIALIGVTNTLSLSVLERRRESATLRALGMTRRQLRTTLAAEGMVIAGVSAVLGAVLGLLYGWAGSAVVFGVAAKVQLAVPWGDLVTVLIVALLAGLTASVVPARTAARTPPVAALAVE